MDRKQLKNWKYATTIHQIETIKKYDLNTLTKYLQRYALKIVLQTGKILKFS